MNFKTIIGISTYFFFFLIGSIVIFGTLNLDSFIPVYFIFTYLLILIAVYIMKPLFESKKEILYFLLIGTIFCLSLNYYAINLKTYYDSENTINLAQNNMVINNSNYNNLSNEIESLMTKNYQAYNYLEYQNKLLNVSSNNLIDLQNEVITATNDNILIKDKTIKELQDTINSKDNTIDEMQDQIDDLIKQQQDVKPTYKYVYEDD